MIEKKVIDYVNECNQKTVDSVTDALDMRFKSLTDYITLDNQNIKDKIKEVKDHVEKQNGSIRGLKEWRASVEGGNKRIKNITPWLAVLIAFLSLIFAYVKTNRTEQDVSYQLQRKQDRPPDPTTRSLTPEQVKEMNKKK